MELSLFAPAKVNLCLHVAPAGKAEMHQVVTLMQPLTLGDKLVIRPGEPGLHFTCSDPKLNNRDNLVMKAARAWCRAAGQEPAHSLHLEKKVPVAAGLGGGSSDAAAALMGLNALSGSALGVKELYRLARRLGADVPFFLAGVTALCGGVGDVITPRPDFPALYYVLINPGFAVSTAWVYGQFDLAWKNQKVRYKIGDSRQSGPVWEGLLVNDLEAVTMRAHPELAKVKGALLGQGAVGALMSGSGPTVFGVFESAEAARKAASDLEQEPKWWVKACEGLGE